MSGDTCPVCGDGTYTSFFELQDVPTQDGVLWNTKQEALNAPTGSIQLAFCRSCGYVGNQAHQPEKIRYDPDDPEQVIVDGDSFGRDITLGVVALKLLVAGPVFVVLGSRRLRRATAAS